MSLFDEYAARDELMRAVDSQIAERVGQDGQTFYRLPNAEADAWRAKYEKAVRADAERRRELETLTRERADAQAELEQLRAEATEPRELRETLRRYVERSNESRAKVAALEAELRPLREENAAYKARETRAKIESQLVDAARKLDCCESAMRDVRRLAFEFHLNDDGIAVNEESQTVGEVLREELAQSPHWLNRSQGASAFSSDARPYDAEERFRAALQGTDFDAVIRNAPRRPVERAW